MATTAELKLKQQHVVLLAPLGGWRWWSALLSLVAFPVVLLAALRTLSVNQMHNVKPPPVFPSPSPSSTDASATTKEGTFLHITDIHWDPHYQPGTDVKHGHCHRLAKSTGKRKSGRILPALAGNFGARGCDSSWSLVNATLEAVERDLGAASSVDFVLWTGDNARHDLDPELPRSLDEIVYANRVVSERLRRTFPPNVFVIPTIGNNDVYPHNSFRDTYSRQILDGLADAWRFHLRPPTAELLSVDQSEPVLCVPPLHMFKQHGFFFRRVSRQLSILSLNTLLFFDTKSLEDVVDPCAAPFSAASQQIRWMRAVMKALRRIELRDSQLPQRVLFIGHIAPAALLYTPRCYEAYRSVASEFAATIRGHFFGHTNFDYFQVMADSRNRPHSIVLTAPPVVPEVPPGLRLFQYQRNTGKLLDYIQFHASLSQVESTGQLRYRRSYSFRETYGVPSLTPHSLFAIREQFLRLPDDRWIDFLIRMVSFDEKWTQRIRGETDDNGAWRNKKKWWKMAELYCDGDARMRECKQLFFERFLQVGTKSRRKKA